MTAFHPKCPSAHTPQTVRVCQAYLQRDGSGIVKECLIPLGAHLVGHPRRICGRVPVDLVVARHYLRVCLRHRFPCGRIAESGTSGGPHIAIERKSKDYLGAWNYAGVFAQGILSVVVTSTIGERRCGRWGSDRIHVIGHDKESIYARGKSLYVEKSVRITGRRCIGIHCHLPVWVGSMDSSGDSCDKACQSLPILRSRAFEIEVQTVEVVGS